MCIVLIAKNTIKDFPLIILANRDEYFQRETQSLNLWGINKEILAGKDLRAGGTWLGVTSSGRVGALTNLPSIKNAPKNKKSRGLIIKDFLTKNVTPCQYVKLLGKTKNEFLGFNLIVGDRESLIHYSNATCRNLVLDDGIHVITNTTFNENWPKGNILKEKVKDVISENPTNLINRFFSILGPSSKQRLLDTSYKESIFVTDGLYGTRSSSVLLFHKDGRCNFNERSYNNHQKVLGEKKFYLKDGKYAEHL